MDLKKTIAALVGAVALSTPAVSRAQQVSKDEESKALRAPTTAEQKKAAAAMAQYLRQDGDDLKATRRADGTEVLDLKDRFQSLAVAKRTRRGVVAGCVTNPIEAKHFVEASAPTSTHAEEK